MENNVTRVKRPRRVPLRRLLSSRFGIVIVLVILTLGVIFGVNSVRVNRDHAITDLSTRARVTAGLVDLFVDEHRRAIEALGSLVTPGPAAADQLRAFDDAFPSFLTLILIDTDGRILAGLPDRTADGMSVVGFDVSDRDYFKVAVREERSYMSGVFRGRGFGDDTIVAISAPVVRDGTIVGVVEGSLSIGGFARFESDLSIPDSEGRSLVVTDSEGRVVYSSWDELEPLSSLVRHALFQFEPGLIFDYDAPGRGRQLGFLHRTNAAWSVLVIQPASTVNRHVRSSVAFTLLWTALALGLAMLVSGRLASKVTHPVETLAASARQLTSGGTFEKPELHGRTIPSEIATLVDDFETMLTQLNHTRLSLEQARDLALEGNRAKSAFLARMSHELRTPLNAILGFAGILERRLKITDAELSAQARHISTAGQTLLSMVEEILEVAQFHPEETAVEIEPFNAEELIREVVEGHRPLIEGHNNRLELTLDCNVQVMVDRVKIESMIRHLVTNANKFTRGGSIHVVSTIANDNLEIVVEDTGVGFDEAQLPQMFSPFWQADESRGRRHEGTGIGLAIIQRYCDLIGGSVEARGHPGRGATFTLRIPINDPDEADT